MTKAQNFIFNEGGLYCVESFDKLSIEEDNWLLRVLQKSWFVILMEFQILWWNRTT